MLFNIFYITIDYFDGTTKVAARGAADCYRVLTAADCCCYWLLLLLLLLLLVVAAATAAGCCCLMLYPTYHPRCCQPIDNIWFLLCIWRLITR